MQHKKYENIFSDNIFGEFTKKEYSIYEGSIMFENEKVCVRLFLKMDMISTLHTIYPNLSTIVSKSKKYAVNNLITIVNAELEEQLHPLVTKEVLFEKLKLETIFITPVGFTLLFSKEDILPDNPITAFHTLEKGIISVALDLVEEVIIENDL